jgi:uncharacterized protein YjiS (DUF1127 family)
MFGIFSRLAHHAGSAFARKRLLDSLSQLDDHLLMDIGLRRDQLETVMLNAPDAWIEEKPVAKQRTISARRPQSSLQGCG